MLLCESNTHTLTLTLTHIHTHTPTHTHTHTQTHTHEIHLILTRYTRENLKLDISCVDFPLELTLWNRYDECV